MSKEIPHNKMHGSEQNNEMPKRQEGNQNETHDKGMSAIFSHGAGHISEQNGDNLNNTMTPKIVLDVAELHRNRDNAFDDCVESIMSSINRVPIENRENGQVALVDMPYKIQKNDLLELRVACFPYDHYVTKMYLCGLLNDEQAGEAMDIEQKMLQSVQENMACGDVADVSKMATPHAVLGQLSLPLIPELVDDYLYRINQISMAASLIDLNGQNLYKRHADVDNYMPRANIFSNAPDETAGCCHVLEELMLIRNDLLVVSGETQSLLSQTAETLYRHVVGEMLANVPEHPLNPGVGVRAAYMNRYFQTLIRDVVTPYDNNTVAENLLRAVKSVRRDIKRNHFAQFTDELDLQGEDLRPWQDIFASACDKAFLDMKKYYAPHLSALKRQKKISSQAKPVQRSNGNGQGHSRTE